MRPMRVFKGKALPGHMGCETVTIQNLEIVKVDVENGYILVKGNVPGPKKSLVIIKTAVKNPNVIKEAEALQSYIVTEEVEVPEAVNTEVEETTEVQTEETQEKEN